MLAGTEFVGSHAGCLGTGTVTALQMQKRYTIRNIGMHIDMHHIEHALRGA